MTDNKKSNDKLIEIITGSTMHGFPNIFKTDRIFLKIVWSICFMVSVGCCAYFVLKGVLDYLNYDVVTIVESFYEPTSLFPSVSFCLLNPFLTDASSQYVNKILEKNGFLFVIDPKLNSLTDNLYTNIYESRYLVAANLESPDVNDSFKKSLAYPLNDLLISCNFNFANCSADDFEWFYDFWYGNCYRFNGGKNASGDSIELKTSSKAGKINGLFIELFVGNENSTNPIVINSGVHLFINNASDMPTTFEGIDLSTGTQTNIAFTRTFYQKLGSPYNDCIENLTSPDSYDSFLYNTTVILYKIYRQTTCFSLCSQLFIIKNCGCYTPAEKSPYTNVLPCTSYLQIHCSVSAFINFYYNQTNGCFSECPVECDTVQFSITTSSSDYPSKAYAEFILGMAKIKSKFSNSTPLTYESLKSSLVSFSVYYSDLNYISISQQEKTALFDLISSIGGTLGLFLGISFLSFIEIFEFGFEAIFLLFERKSLKKINSIPTPPKQLKN